MTMQQLNINPKLPPNFSSLLRAMFDFGGGKGDSRFWARFAFLKNREVTEGAM